MTTLVFLPGWGADRDIWRRQVEAFSGPGITVLTPAFPVWEASWLTGYLQELPLAETVLVGWSLGGMLLLEALAQEQLEPAGLVLVATPASFCQRPDHPFGQPRSVVRALRRTVRADPSRGLADFAARCLSAHEEDFQGQLLQHFQPWEKGADLTGGLDYLLNTDLRSHLPRVPSGALIIQGGRDAIVPPVQADFLGQYLKNACLVKFPEAGHAPFFTQADRFNEVIVSFLREGASGTGIAASRFNSLPNPLREKRPDGDLVLCPGNTVHNARPCKLPLPWGEGGLT